MKWLTIISLTVMALGFMAGAQVQAAPSDTPAQPTTDYAVVAPDRPTGYQLTHFTAQQTKDGFLLGGMAFSFGLWMLALLSLSVQRAPVYRYTQGLGRRPIPSKSFTHV